MAFMITEECTNCQSCVPVCPTGAIGVDTLRRICFIHPNRCNECVGYFNSPRCLDVCPLDCGILPDIYRLRSVERLRSK